MVENNTQLNPRHLQINFQRIKTVAFQMSEMIKLYSLAQQLTINVAFGSYFSTLRAEKYSKKLALKLKGLGLFRWLVVVDIYVPINQPSRSNFFNLFFSRRVGHAQTLIFIKAPVTVEGSFSEVKLE